MSYYLPEVPPSPIQPPAPRSGKGREVLSALVISIAVAVAGVVLGLAWYLIAPPLPLRKVEAGMAFTNAQPEELVAQDGTFSILGFAFGIIAAVVVWVLVRRWRGPLQMIALLIGAAGAGFLAWKVGTQIGQDEYRQAVASAPLGTVIDRPAELQSSSTKICLATRCVTTRGGDILVPAMGAVVAYAVLAGWSRFPSLRREEEEEREAAVPAQGASWPEIGQPPQF